jgi:hypothetical protein
MAAPTQVAEACTPSIGEQDGMVEADIGIVLACDYDGRERHRLQRYGRKAAYDVRGAVDIVHVGRGHQHRALHV